MRAVLVAGLLAVLWFICQPTVDGFDGNPDTTTIGQEATP